MWSGVVQAVCLWLALLPLTMAHICIISPRQRGPFDISQRGSFSCNRHEYPCGGQAPQNPPFQQLNGGVAALIKWQQNLNHYSIGNPGFMDVSYATSQEVANAIADPGLPDPFKLLFVVEDKHEYAQGHQRNYTAVFQLPNVACDHCVIRMRYESRKPDETPFYQCSDISIKKTSPQEQLTKKGQVQLLPLPKTDASVSGVESLQKALELIKKAPTDAGSDHIYGLMNEMLLGRGSVLVAADAGSGYILPKAPLSFRVDSPFFTPGRYPQKTIDFVTDFVLSMNGMTGVLTMPLNQHNNMSANAHTVIDVDTKSGKEISRNDISYADESPVLTSGFSAVLFEGNNSYITFNIVEDTKQPGTYRFVVGRLSRGGLWQQISMTTTVEKSYVNFLWADYDIGNTTLYVLLGNEGDVAGQSARMYKFPVLTSTARSSISSSYVNLDVSRYPFMAFHRHPTENNLVYAISPGLLGVKTPSIHLVVVDVNTGEVNHAMEVAPAGIFQSYYGGAVINGFDPQTGNLIHVLRVADTNADVIAYVNIPNNHVTFSQVTNLRHVYSMYRKT